MEKYALLFAGCINNRANHIRYSNDLGFMYKVLTSNYSYDKSNIKVLYANGQKITYDGINIDTEIATYINLKHSLIHYQTLLTADDLLVVMFSNHGSQTGINTWGQEIFSQSDFINLLSNIKAKKVILLGQCFGGNLLSQQIDNSILVSANQPDRYSFSTKSSQYDEFYYHFISYLNGMYPDGNLLTASNSDLSINAAYLYVKNNNIYKTPGVVINSIEFYESPDIRHYGCDPTQQRL